MRSEGQMTGMSRAAKIVRTQWTAQFLAAAELSRRGYLVSFTMGNHTPMADLMVGHLDGGAQFWVDVKGLSAAGAWLLGEKDLLDNLFFILVLIGEEREQDRFFIMTQVEAKQLIADYWLSHPNQKRIAALAGFNLIAACPYKNRWGKLPRGKGGVAGENVPTEELG